MVDESFELSSQTATTAEKATRAEIWTENLSGLIPEARLREAFRYALSTHNSTYPINAYEILDAWHRIQDREHADWEKEQNEQQELVAATERIEKCSEKNIHIDRDGNVRYVNPLNTDEDIVMPCYTCRHAAWQAARTQNVRRYAGQPTTTDAFNNLVREILAWAESRKMK